MPTLPRYSEPPNLPPPTQCCSKVTSVQQATVINNYSRFPNLTSSLSLPISSEAKSDLTLHHSSSKPTVPSSSNKVLSSMPSPIDQIDTTCTCRTGCYRSDTCLCRKTIIRCTFLCHPGHSCFNCIDPSEVVDLTKKCGEMDFVQEAVTGKMVLTTTQHQILSSTRWLDDSLMNMGQIMLLQQHPHINGLQNVLLGQKFAFNPQAEEFVQILHENENHWITVSTIGCPPSTINVYDSLHGTVLSQSVFE